jgi:gliding motility-associated-like protein
MIFKNKLWTLHSLNNANFILFIICFQFCLLQAAKAQLVINEVSQGSSGNMEFVELLVKGVPSCAGGNCVDLRGWIIDDNNGWHATGPGMGIAPGCMRFSNDPIWACVSLGTLILIYNESDKNPKIPADNLTGAGCRFVIPGNNPVLFDKNTSEPSVGGTASYVSLSFSSGGNWQTIAMGNTGDTFHTISPANPGSDYFAVSWANNTSNSIIYFTGNAGGFDYSMMNASSNDPFLQANWSKMIANASNETPGLPNNAANANWINQMSNNCKAFSNFSASKTSTDASCQQACNGTAKIVPDIGSISSYTYKWDSNPVQTTSQATNLCTGTYHITVSDANNCTLIDSVEIKSPPGLLISASEQNPLCYQSNDGAIFVNVISGNLPLSFLWSNGMTSRDISSLSPGNYSLSITDANMCKYDTLLGLTEPDSIQLGYNSSKASCGLSDGKASVIVSGGSSPYQYLWSNGETKQQVDDLSSGIHQVIVIDKNLCRDTLSVSIGSRSGFYPDFSYSPMHPDIFDSHVYFQNETHPTDRWQWDFGGLGSSDLENPDFSFPEAGTYPIRFIAANGTCLDTITKNLIIEDNFLIYVPNAFTPELDGNNEYFRAVVRGVDPTRYELIIFDRWGNEVFTSHDPDEGWDGYSGSEKQPDGIYTWVLTCTDIRKQPRHYVGRVNLMR